MMTLSMQNKIVVTVAVAVACALAWLWMSTSAATPSTYAFFALLLLSVALVGFNTWNNGQPTGSMAQVIHEADITSAPAAPSADTKAIDPSGRSTM